MSEQTMTAPVLKISRLTKSFDDLTVLKDISVSIQKGEFLVLLGPSGCGKSTLLNCIAGLEEISGGDLRINGSLMNEVPPKDRDIAMVFQSYALYPNMTVAENIEFGMKVRGIEAKARSEKSTEVAGLLQMENLLDRKPSQLSGGQRQRVAMGRALVRDPVLFLFDEPLSNLDAQLRVEMRAEIRNLHQTLGSSIIYVTHDQIEALTMATKIVVLKDGIVQQTGTPNEIYDKPGNIFVAGFMGAPAMNLIPAIMDADGKCVIEREDADPLHLKLPDNRLASMPVTLGIRPENMTNSIAAGSQNSRVVDCRIKGLEPTGSDIFATVGLGGTDALVRLRANSDAAVGENLEIVFDLTSVSLFDPETGVRLN